MAIIPLSEPYSDSVSVLVPFEGDFTDYSPSPRTITATGGASISALQKKHGDDSCLFDGSTGYLTTPAATYFDFGTGDFTAEAYVRPASIGSIMVIMGIQEVDGVAFQLRITATGELEGVFRSNDSTTVYTATSTATLSADTWHHVAVSRVSGEIRIFIDGVHDGSVTSSAILTANGGSIEVYLGALNDGEATSSYFDGNIDDWRVTKGVGRYTATFTPPGDLFTLAPEVTIGATNADDTAALSLLFYPDIDITIGATNSDDVTSLSLSLGIPLQIGAVNDGDVSALGLFHDWTTGDLPSGGEEIYVLDLIKSGFEALRLPMRSFQASMTNGRASYSSAVVPSARQYADEINDRTGGLMVVQKGLRFHDGTEVFEKIASITLSEVRIDDGSSSGSTTLSGYEVLPTTPIKTRILNGVRYRSTSNGKRRVRCAIDLFLRAGDTAVDDGDSFTVDSITYIVGESSKRMEVQE